MKQTNTSLTRSFPIHDVQVCKQRLIAWASQFPYAMVVDNCNSTVDQYGEYELLMGVANQLSTRTITNYQALTKTQEATNRPFLMGVLTYRLRKTLETSVEANKPAYTSFPDIAFFEPKHILYIKRAQQILYIESIDANQVYEEVLQTPPLLPPNQAPPTFLPTFSKKSYIETIEALREHIAAGDCYEINLAQAFLAEYTLEQPAWYYQKLIELSPVPFAAYFQFDQHTLICASPERFLQLKGNRIISQPIKGTSARGKTPEEDQTNIRYLQTSSKEQAENIMIVDLTRNDIYKSSRTNSVSVPHLFEIQSFPQVHQMVSTIQGEKRPELSATDVIANTFPPGSMTGAPKVMAMNLIDRYEPIQRGMYAGSIGYITPKGDFDFNVIIRSLIYDAQHQKLSYHVGGAITYDSQPEAEYEETLIKAQAIRKLFGGSHAI